MAVTRRLLGKDAKLYWGAVGSQASIEGKNIIDLAFNMEKNSSDATTRESDWDQEAMSTKKASITFNMIWDPEDPMFDAFLGAFLDNKQIACLVLDRAIADGGQGLDADFEIKKFVQNQKLREVITVDVEIVPGRSDRVPAYVKF